MEKENSPQIYDVTGENSVSRENEASGTYSISRCSVDKEAGLTSCRVCQCFESDKKGDAVLGFLGITAPQFDAHKSNEEEKPNGKVVSKDIKDDFQSKSDPTRCRMVEFISPSGEVFICHSDIETGFDHNHTLIELGCACKNDLALVHYACALKWFVNHGSTVCEICSCVAKNIRTTDFKKVMSCLKEYEVLRERTVNGEPYSVQVQASSCVDPDAIAAIRRQRLSEISLWFSPRIANNSAEVPQFLTDQPSAFNVVPEENIPAENNARKWAVEGTGILLATGLLTVTLAWLIAPHVGKKTAKNGLHILLGGVCALTVVVFFRFFVLTRIKYGPARYWAILFVFWFLVFGIWASRTHNAHGT